LGIRLNREIGVYLEDLANPKVNADLAQTACSSRKLAGMILKFNNNNMKEENFNIFLNALLIATEQITDQYFLLPVAYDAEFIQRERHYCYELYGKIRENLPLEFGYILSGEINKAGHPLVAPHCGDIIPDFLVHHPGHMGPDDNLAIIEVKTIAGANFNNENTGFLKDLRTLNCMMNIENGYYKGIVLVFGAEDQLRKEQLTNIYRERCNQERLLLIFHESANQRATIVQ
jgi:hypothetical protein